MPTIFQKSASWLLFVSFVLSLIYGFQFNVPIIVSGVLIFISAVALITKINGLQRIQVLALFIAGLILIILSDEDTAIIEKALTINYAIIALIISISFLRLILPSENESEKLPLGLKALWNTLSSVFLFSSVLNFSAIAIFGDRLSRQQKLDRSHIMILSRMFGANAFWSPFFASMGTALVYSGEPNLNTLLIAGLSLALCSIVLTALQCFLEINRNDKEFVGYPIKLESLFIPFLLSLLVILTHLIFQSISIVILVSTVVVVTVVIFIFIKHPYKALSILINHIEKNIVTSASEILLFFSAGVFAVGISAYLLTIDFQLPISSFTGINAVITLIIMIMASIFGVHPIASISIVGGILSPLSPDPNLLGIVFLFCWGLSVPLSSFSAVSLLIQSRYHIKAIELFKTNLSFTLTMLIPASLIIYFYGNNYDFG